MYGYQGLLTVGSGGTVTKFSSVSIVFWFSDPSVVLVYSGFYQIVFRATCQSQKKGIIARLQTFAKLVQ